MASGRLIVWYWLTQWELESRLLRAFEGARAWTLVPAPRCVTALQPVPGVRALVFDAGVRAERMFQVARVRQRYPSVACIAYLTLRDAHPRTVFGLAQAGVDALCLAGIDDHPSVLRQIVESAVSRVLTRQVTARLNSLAPGLLWGQIDSILLRLPTFRSPRDLADLCGVSLARLRRHLRRAGFPPPPGGFWRGCVYCWPQDCLRTRTGRPSLLDSGSTTRLALRSGTPAGESEGVHLVTCSGAEEQVGWSIDCNRNSGCSPGRGSSADDYGTTSYRRIDFVKGLARLTGSCCAPPRIVARDPGANAEVHVARRLGGGAWV